MGEMRGEEGKAKARTEGEEKKKDEREGLAYIEEDWGRHDAGTTTTTTHKSSPNHTTQPNPRRRPGALQPAAARLFLLVLPFFAAILPHQDISPANGLTAQTGRESRQLTNKRRGEDKERATMQESAQSRKLQSKHRDCSCLIGSAVVSRIVIFCTEYECSRSFFNCA